MKITNILLTTTIFVTTLFFISCKKDNTGGNAGIKYKVQTTNRSSIVGRIAAGNIQWTSGSGYATKIKFEAESNDREVEFKSEIPQRIDLFSGITTLGNVTLPPGTYEEVEFEVELNTVGANFAFELNGQLQAETLLLL